MHPKSIYNAPYDFDRLIVANPSLKNHLILNKSGAHTIDYFKPKSVLELNKSLLISNHGAKTWHIPSGYLCPPIPSRLDYLYYLNDLRLDHKAKSKQSRSRTTVFDVGVGANCIYALLGALTFGWRFVGSDVSKDSISIANKNIIDNDLSSNIEVRLQSNKNQFFNGCFKPNERFDFTVCNPPFHKSEKEATEKASRKLSNLKGAIPSEKVLNFGGLSNELWCDGGERRFLSQMIKESKTVQHNVFWFTSLVSAQSNLKALEAILKETTVFDYKIIPMIHGHKKTRIIAWTFLNSKQQKLWKNARWT